MKNFEQQQGNNNKQNPCQGKPAQKTQASINNQGGQHQGGHGGHGGQGQGHREGGKGGMGGGMGGKTQGGFNKDREHR